MSGTMPPFSTIDSNTLRDVDVVLTDVDDTLTRHGKLCASTLNAMERLAAAGIRLVPVTGGCAGWCDHIVRAWPVAAVIGESGAFRFIKRSDGSLDQRFVRPREHLREEQRRLLQLAETAISAVPAARLAADQPYRLADVAIDHSQDVGPLGSADIDRLIGYMRNGGARARASSIHVNAWFGDHDKASMAVSLLEEDFGFSAREQERRVLFIGDAPNDESLFARFPLSMGVANISQHLSTMQSHPRWICQASHGAGFEEMAERLLAARNCLGPSPENNTSA
ncbi:HAD-IIB family hydrolase [Modicisalibacter luteus]|uniref:HAD-IIB family hydrolase n=1 Tax=Modicisalibacter luteus TaxID=453962 RepID=A0ABV7LZ12_9GAMM|nr:HAD-IIB family hydrolase [Halomonas lutea]GHB02322.1 haloacid dehalogenase [Halomonas lutea]